MPAFRLRRLALLGAAFLLAAPVAASLPGAPPSPPPVLATGPGYSEADLRLIHEEAAATGGATYTFYILGSTDRDVIDDAWRRMESPSARTASMRAVLGVEPQKQQAFALPANVREQLRQLRPGEHSRPFALDRRNWAMVELETIDPATSIPAFESLRNALPKLVTSGAVPEPRRLASDPALVQRRLMNKAVDTASFDRLPPGFDIDAPLSLGYTLLQRALLQDDPRLVTAVLTRAANTNLCLMRQCPLPLALRSAAHHAGYVQQLLAAGARPDQVSGPGEDTPLTLASANGQLEAVRALLAAGADRNGADGPNLPLAAALVTGQRAVAQLLLDMRADPLARKPLPGGKGFYTAIGGTFDRGNVEDIAWMRGVLRKHTAARKAWRWDFWVEQDGAKVPVTGNRLHLKRKPFTLHVRMAPGAELRLEASTSQKLFEEHKSGDLRQAPLFQLGRVYGELHDGSARALLVSDFAQRSADAARHGGIQAWSWNATRKDFTRQDKSPQGPVLVREITALVLDDANGRTEVALEKSRLREIALVIGTSVDYTSQVGDFANARRLRLVFDR